MPAHVVPEPHLSDFPGSFVCMFGSHTFPEKEEKKGVKVKSEAED